jgi:hypothetical protein
MTPIAYAFNFVFSNRDVVLIICAFALGVGILGTALELWKYRRW